MKTTAKALLQGRLREERIQRGWSQKYVAEHIGAERYYISRWERSIVSPGAHYRQLLCTLFGKSARELGLLPEEAGPGNERPDEANISVSRIAQLSATPALDTNWTIPFGRNSFFTGREALLLLLHEKLHPAVSATACLPLALSGLGGVGKTQLALEYAYCYRTEYTAVFWLTATTLEALATDCKVLAERLHLPVNDTQTLSEMCATIRQWLRENEGWLLLLDAIDDISIVPEIVPREHKGHILLTTRSQLLGPHAEGVMVEKMVPEEGALLLLRRAKFITHHATLTAATPDEWATALTLAHLLDGIPLALDQAASYIDETACGLQGYHSRYQTRRMELLAVRGTSSDHPVSMAETVTLAFHRITRANKAAAEFLQFCALLQADSIPEELLTEGAAELGGTLQAVAADLLSIDSMIGELRKYSLVYRIPTTATLTISHLVLDILRETMDERVQLKWVERTIRTINRVFPEVTFASWPRCQRLLPQVLHCLALARHWQVQLLEAAHVFDRGGTYMRTQAYYQQVEPLYLQALAIRNQLLAPLHADIAHSLQNLALLYNELDNYEQAEVLLNRALAMVQQTAVDDPLAKASILTCLAHVYDNQGRFDLSKPLYQQALGIYQMPLGTRKQTSKLQDPAVATCLSSLGWLYFVQGEYSQARPLLLAAVTMRQQLLGPGHPDVAQTLNQLAELSRVQGTYAQSALLLQQTLSIREQALRADHPDFAQSFNALGKLSLAQGLYEQAEAFYRRALAVSEQAFGLNHSTVAVSLNALAELYYAWQQYDQVEALSKQALTILKPLVYSQHPQVAISLHLLANISSHEGRYAEAELLYRQVIAAREQSLNSNHPDLANCLEDYAAMLHLLQRESEALTLEQRVQNMRIYHGHEY